MVQIIEENRRPSLSERLASGLGRGLEIGTNFLLDRQRRQALQEAGIPADLPEDLQKTYLSEKLRGESKQNILAQKMKALGLGGDETKQRTSSFDETLREDLQTPERDFGRLESSEIEDRFPSDEEIARHALIDPNFARIERAEKDAALKEKRALRKEKRQEFETERAFHTGLSKKAQEEVDVLRTALPRKEMALDLARNAVESGNLGFLSPDKLADRTGIDLFRTAKGAQLITAGKENLLNNMSRISARAQNMWFEQRLNSMFPKIGQSREANLTVQEMLEGEASLDQAYLNEFDRLSEQDEQQLGFIRKDIKKRATQASKPIENDIFKRTTYRLKEIEEQEKGLTSLKNQVGKNVPKGTPLTLAMAKLYKDKFGDKALSVAEKNGYFVPSLEEFRMFQQRPKEFREGLME